MKLHGPVLCVSFLPAVQGSLALNLSPRLTDKVNVQNINITRVWIIIIVGQIFQAGCPWSVITQCQAL